MYCLVGNLEDDTNLGGVWMPKKKKAHWNYFCFLKEQEQEEGGWGFSPFLHLPKVKSLLIQTASQVSVWV